MSTAQTIIDQALRALGVVAADQTPQAIDRDTALPVLRDMLSSAVQDFSGVRFAEVVDPPDATTLSQGTRVLVTVAGAKTLNLPAMPSDGARIIVVDTTAGTGGPITLARNGRRVQGAAANLALAAGGATALRYRADTADWITETVTALTSPIPYPGEFWEGLTAMLAVRLAPYYAQAATLTPITIGQARDCEAKLRDRYAPRQQLRGGAVYAGDRIGGAQGQGG